MILLNVFYSCLCLYFLFLPRNVDCWRILKYTPIGELAPVTTIPDPKWHFFEVFIEWDRLVANLTSSVPVLRYCTFDEAFRIFIHKGQPRFELLLLMRHAKGDHLLNFTFADDGNIFVNNEFFYTCNEFLLPVDRTELFLRRQEGGWALWSRIDRKGFIPIGNGPIKKPIHPWIYTLVDGDHCYEIKVKVFVGYIQYTVLRKWNAWPTVPYDDEFFETTTTITTIAATSTANAPENGENYQESETTHQHSKVNKASTMQGLIYAVCGILVLIAATLLFFLGFRFGRCFARKRALKTGLLKSGVKESKASEPGSDTGAITPDASANPAESTKTPTKAVASTPTTKTNTEKNPIPAKSVKPRTPITPTTKDEVESSAVPTEPILMSNKSNRTV